MEEGGELRGALRQPPAQYPLGKDTHPTRQHDAVQRALPGQQETWIPALSLGQICHMTLDKPLNLSTPQFSHLYLRALNEMMAHLPFTSNSITQGS